MSNKNEKYNEILNEFYEKIPIENRSHYEELASKAIALGYYPIRDKTKCLSISFRNNKLKYTIMKFAEERKNEYLWKLKFSATKNYSKVFNDYVNQCIDGYINSFSEKYGFKNNVFCFGCIRCGNIKKLWYSIEYEDGKKSTLCGHNPLIHIEEISKEIVEEAGEMMQVQHEKLIE